MKKYTVTATMDMGFKAIIEAPSKEAAWTIAKKGGDYVRWEQTSETDWTLEQIWENNNE